MPKEMSAKNCLEIEQCGRKKNTNVSQTLLGHNFHFSVTSN